MNETKFFLENGYYIIDHVFSDLYCDEIIELAKNLNYKEDFVPIMNIHKSSSKIIDLMSNEKIINFIEKIFDGSASGLQTEYFFMPPGTKGFSPHQDNTYVRADQNSFISAWVALTNVNHKNGGLKIWPKTHKEKQLKLINNEEIECINQDPNARKMKTIIPEKYKMICPKISKGSVLMIHSWLVHASNDNNSSSERNALLCTYIKEGADYRSGNYAKRKSFHLRRN